MPGSFGKVKVEVPVRYKFISKVVEVTDETVHAGRSNNFSSKGIVLQGKLPSDELLGHLLRGEVYVGMNIMLPNREEPIKALGKIFWIEVDEKRPEWCEMGANFVEIDKDAKDALVRFTIRAQITKRF